MPDAASTIQRTLALRRVDPEHGMARFYALTPDAVLDLTIRQGRHEAHHLVDLVALPTRMSWDHTLVNGGRAQRTEWDPSAS